MQKTIEKFWMISTVSLMKISIYDGVILCWKYVYSQAHSNHYLNSIK